MNPRRKILVVDDEPQIGRVLRTSLSSRGYDVRVASDGESAMDVFSAWSPDLVITDLSMPNVTGVELCRRLRESSQVPIIVLSVKGEEHTKIEALDSGADDYVTKPFSINELLARIRAGLRRTVPEKEAELPEIISIGDFFIDRKKHIVTVRNKEIRLTPKEFDLLVCMASRPGEVLRHRELLNDVWGGQSVEQPEYLRVFINQLRKKIEPADTPRYILTEPWVGYRFQPETE
ncbi:MAG TPA: response regulator transcription factor [Candidatus Angelobacter sp.]|nr:response regulator transcription factor [Candidatus Angelobacter sp.]